MHRPCFLATASTTQQVAHERERESEGDRDRERERDRGREKERERERQACQKGFLVNPPTLDARRGGLKLWEAVFKVLGCDRLKVERPLGC